MIASIIFILVLVAAIFIFTVKVRSISSEIKLGKDLEIRDNKTRRWKLMAKVAIGQSKMVQRPLSAILHIFVMLDLLSLTLRC